MSKGSAPPAPDYTGAAQATAQGNLANLDAQTAANRPTQVTPWGTSSWTNTPGSGGTSSWSQNISLSPDQQAALNSQMQIQQNQSQLAQNMQGQVTSQMSNGFTAPTMDSYTNGVPAVNSSFQGFNPSGVGAVNQSQINPVNYTSSYNDLNQNFKSGTGNVDLNAPQFDQSNADAGTKAAYSASTGLLTDQWHQDTKNLDSQLRMQGMTPGTEGYNNAMQNMTRVQGQQQDQLANQAVVTGNQLANTNYASALAGYQSQNAAQGQAFNEGLSSFNADNAASTQSLQNGLSQYSAAIQGQGAQNTAVGQAYNQALGTYGVGQQAQLNSNSAQQQSYQQAMQQYQSAYSNAYQNYLQPLNSMNAVLTGQQVSMPQMPGFTSSGYTPGADMTGATSALGQYNSGLYAQNSANSSSALGAIGSLAGAAAIAF
jgi:hypothetical protein